MDNSDLFFMLNGSFVFRGKGAGSVMKDRVKERVDEEFTDVVRFGDLFVRL